MPPQTSQAPNTQSNISPNDVAVSLGHANTLLQQTLPPPQNKPQEAPQEQGDEKLGQLVQIIGEEFKKQREETQKMIQDAVGGLRQDIATAIAEEDKQNAKT